MRTHLSWSLALLFLLAAACGDIVVAADPDTTVSQDLVVSLDTALPDAGVNSDIVSTPDVLIVPDYVAEDVVEGILVTPTQPPEVTCAPWATEFGGEITATLRWETSVPALCDIVEHIPGQDPFEIFLDEGAPAVFHEVDMAIDTYAFATRAPEPGDTPLWIATCHTVGGTLEGQSGDMHFTLGAELLACLWPFACGDGSGMACPDGSSLAICAEGLAPAVEGGCVRCRNPETCDCSDGSELTCDTPAPDCIEPMFPVIRDGCYVCVHPDTCDEPAPECSDFVTSRAACNFALVYADEETPCETTSCLRERCTTDEDCVRAPTSIGVHSRCVLGNCVECANNGDCLRGQLCRAGRCVVPDLDRCPEVPDCGGSCHLLTLSDVPCPVCVCDRDTDAACEADDVCRENVLSQQPHCLYGHCAACLNDEDCTDNMACIPPGVCATVKTDLSQLFGLWLLFDDRTDTNHASYLRFEPDGTVRRGRYEGDAVFTDDVAIDECSDVTAKPPGGLLGYWRAATEQADGVELYFSVNRPCLPNQGWTRTKWVSFDGDTLSMMGDAERWNGVRVSNPDEVCADDLSECLSPRFVDSLDL